MSYTPFPNNMTDFQNGLFTKKIIVDDKEIHFVKESGQRVSIGLDSDENINILSIVPIGSMFMWPSETMPTTGQWMECDGSALLRADYPHLFSVLGTQWGEGDGSTTFNLPDTRGMFPRGWNHGKSTGYFDPDAASRTASANGGATGDSVGTQQNFQIQSHTHDAPIYDGLGLNGPGAGSDHYGAIQTGVSGGNETRPVNFSVMYIIRVL